MEEEEVSREMVLTRLSFVTRIWDWCHLTQYKFFISRDPCNSTVMFTSLMFTRKFGQEACLSQGLAKSYFQKYLFIFE